MNQDSIIVACGRCGAKNRIPRNRMGDGPICGKCKRPLALDNRYPERAVPISDQTFIKEVLDFPGPVLVYFWSPGCGHCQRLNPVIEQLASEYSGRLKFTKLILDQNHFSASQYSVQSVPTLIFFKSGRQQDRVVGALPREEIERHLRMLL